MREILPNRKFQLCIIFSEQLVSGKVQAIIDW